ncbi:rhox homeobox family member 2B-like [Mesocricetus auratus]|uniref:Rhox homeobox family member 2B-like n=1 Tax=Mesocricetus auratus TaxID=10036 RepID=A0ABM2XDJ4_MESAU|nr:rhox homeobox family member 2B-like [Mesocricetus auratus]
MEHQNVDYLLHVRSDKDKERWNGAETPMVLPGGEGRNEEETAQGQPEQGAAAAEGEAAGELSGEGPSAAGAEGLVDEGNQEERGAEGSGQENNPGHQGMGGNEAVPPLPLSVRWTCTHPVRILVPECRPRHHHRFTLPQLQELESTFRRSHYISPAEAKRMAACMGISEARVQRWFWKRREQYRRYKRL